MPFSPSFAAQEEIAAALITACQQDNNNDIETITQIQSLIAQYPGAVASPDNHGWTALHHACANGASLELVHTLVMAQPTVLSATTASSSSTTKKNTQQCTVLHIAASCPETKLEVIDFLLQQRPALARELDALGASALHWVCRGNAGFGGSRGGKTHAGLDIFRRVYEAWTDAIYLADQQGYLSIHLAYLTGAPGSQIRYLAALDPNSVSSPLPDGRLLVHCLFQDVMEGKPNTTSKTLENLILADPATLYVPNPLTGKTLREIAKDPSVRKSGFATQLAKIIDDHENMGGGGSSKGGLKSPKGFSSSKTSSKDDKSDLKMMKKTEGGKGGSVEFKRFSKEVMADNLVLAFTQDNMTEQVSLILKTCPEAVRVRDKEGFLPLHWACYHGAPLEVLRLMVETWPESVRDTISQDRLPLHLACRANASVDRIQFLVSKYEGSLEKPTTQGMLSLHYACRDNAPLGVIEFMVDQAPLTLHQPTQSGLYPIHLSCKHGKNTDAVKFLVKQWPGCLREPTNNKDKLLPAHYLCRTGSFAPLHWMIQQDPQLLEFADGEGNLPLHWLCKNPKATLEVVKVVLDICPEAASKMNAQGLTPVDIAGEVNTEIANFLESAALSKRRKTGGKRPLHQACSDPRVTVQTVMDILAESPDEVCVPDEERMLPIHIACRSGVSLDVIRLLAEDWPESLRWTNRGGSLPLHTACSNQASATVVQYLITSWPKATGVANSYGWLPLHCACAYGASSDVIGILVQSNSKSSSMATYGQGDYPLHLACCGSPTLGVIFWLNEALEEGVKKANTAGELALHKACFNNAPMEVIEFLVEQNPTSLFVADQYGSTPQKIAEMKRNYHVAEYLRSKEA